MAAMFDARREEWNDARRVSCIWIYTQNFQRGPLLDNIWRTIFEGQYLKDNIWRSYLNNIWTIEFFLKDNIWEGQYFNIILDTGDTPIFFRFFSKNLEFFQKKFLYPQIFFFDSLSKNLKFRKIFGYPQKKFWPPKKFLATPKKI